MAGTSVSRTIALADAVAQLPKSNIVEFRKGQIIYSGGQPSSRIYFVVQGEVAVSRLATEGSPVVVGIYKAHDLFGESVLVNYTSKFEQAVALEDARLMSWTAAEVADTIVKQPHLGMALVQNLVERESELRWRIESFAIDRILQRVARALIRLSERLGTPQEDGWVRMIPLTHKLISQYIGSTREIVTHHMTEFRRMGYVNYSRNAILVNRRALEAWLDQHQPGHSVSWS